jgi:hypothetical protein
VNVPYSAPIRLGRAPSFDGHQIASPPLPRAAVDSVLRESFEVLVVPGAEALLVYSHGRSFLPSRASSPALPTASAKSYG